MRGTNSDVAGMLSAMSSVTTEKASRVSVRVMDPAYGVGDRTHLWGGRTRTWPACSRRWAAWRPRMLVGLGLGLWTQRTGWGDSTHLCGGRTRTWPACSRRWAAWRLRRLVGLVLGLLTQRTGWGAEPTYEGDELWRGRHALGDEQRDDREG